MGSATRVRRAPRPWWFRLIGWLLALTVVIAAVLLVVDRSTYGATTHTMASAPQAPERSEPAPTVQALADYPADAQLVGGSVVRLNEHGAIALDPQSGKERWRYQRADSSVCASAANAQRVVLIFGNGERCAEAISLDPESGARQWQRSIEAADENTIRFNDDGFVSVDRTKVIVYEATQGYERFTVDTSKNTDVEGPQSSCENLDATGLNMVATLQRCRSNDAAPWALQIVVNSASDGKPREGGRSYLASVADPQLLGVSADGAAFIRASDGAVTLYPLGAQQPTTIDGLPSLAGEIDVLSTRGAVIVSDATTAYALDAKRTTVQWSTAIVARPSQFGVRLYIPTAAGIELRDINSATLLRTITLPGAVPAGATISVSGPLVGVRSESGLAIYR